MKFYTITELVERWGRKRDAIYAWIDSGELPALNLSTSGKGRSYYKVSSAAVEEFELGRSPSKKHPAKKTTKRRSKKAATKSYIV